MLADSFCLIINNRKINQSFDFVCGLNSVNDFLKWIVAQFICDVVWSPCYNLKWKQTQGMCGEYCISTGFWLLIPTSPTFWNSFVVIIGMTFMPINTVAVELCPYVNPPSVLPFSIFLKLWQSGTGGMWQHWLDFKGLHLASSVCIHYAQHREQLLRNRAVTSAHHD